MSVEYNNNSVYVSPPVASQGSETVYVRPGDTINLEFSLESSKVEISNGDLVFSLPDGGRVILVSLVEMSFANNPPTLVDTSGQEYTINDIVTSLEVVRQTDAVLIITQADVFDKSAEERPAEVISASDQEGNDVSGSPTGGDGDVAYATDGSPTDKVNPLGVVPGILQQTGIGIYPATPNTDNEVGNSDSDSTLPGDISYQPQNSLDITYYYGDTVVSLGPTTIDGKSFETIQIESGTNIRNEDPQLQIQPSDINQQLGSFAGTSSSYFINARYTNDKIIRAVSVDYQGFKPVSIDIVNVPDDVDVVTTSSASIVRNADGSFTISKIPPGGDLTFNIVYDAGRPDEAFNMEYKVLYYDEYGEAVSFNYSQNIRFKTVTSSAEFDTTDIVFSTDAGGVKVSTSIGDFDDIIVGGGASNEVNTFGGNDYYFSGAGVDIVNLGDGNDMYYGNVGYDIARGGAGIDTIRFDNEDLGLSGLDSALYNTYRASQGMHFYLSVTQANVSALPNITTDVLGSFVDGDTYIATSQGQVIKEFEVYYGTQYGDTFHIGQYNLSTDVSIYAVEGGGIDTVTFDIWTTGVSFNVASHSITVGTYAYTFVGFDVYVGSAQDDVFESAVNADLDGVTIDGAAGDDILSYANQTDSIIVDANSRTVTDQAVTYSNEFANIETIIGSQGDDTFKGSINTNLTYSGDSGNDTLTYQEAKAGISFDAMSNRIYKTANETFTLDDLSSKNVGYDTIGTSIEVIEFTKSSDIFYFSDSSSGTPTFTNIDAIEGIDTVHLVGVANASIVFDSGSLLFNHKGATFTIDNAERVKFGDTDDTFTINTALNGKSFYILGGGGVDTIDFSATSNNVSFDLGIGIATVTGGSSGTIQFMDVERFVGSQVDDVFYVSNAIIENAGIASNTFLDGDDGFDTLSFRKVNAGSDSLIYDATDPANVIITYGGNSLTFNITNIEGIEGTVNDDTFTINYNNSGTQNAFISGGSGTDTIILAPSPSVAVELNLIAGTIGSDKFTEIEIFSNLSDLDDNVIMAIGGFQINAGAGTADTADYSQISSSVEFTFFEDGKLTSQVGNITASLSVLTGFEVVIGTSSDDMFNLVSTNTTGSDIVYTIQGGSGNNRISFADSNAAITGFTLAYDGSHVFTGTNSTTYNWESIQGFTFTNYDDVVISASHTDSYVVDGGGNTATGVDTIDYSSLTGTGITYQMAQGWVIKDGGVDRISNFEHIIATDFDDTFILTSEINGLVIDAGAGTDSVNLSSINGDSFVISFDGSQYSGVLTDGADVINMTFIDVENLFSSSADVTTLKILNSTTAGTYSGTYVFQSNNLDAKSYVDFSDIGVGISYDLNTFAVNELSGPDIFAADFALVLNTITGIILTDNNDTVIGSENISIQIDGGAGTDTIDYSSFSNAIYFNLGTGEFLKISNNLTDVVTNVEILIGTGGNDIFSFGSDSSVINSLSFTTIDGGNGEDSISFADITGTDTLAYVSTASSATITVGTTVLGVGSILNMESLIGTERSDSFTISGVGSSSFSPSNIGTFDGGGGTDTLDISSYTTDLILNFNSLGVGTTTLSGASITLINIENYVLGSGNDTVYAGLSGSHHYNFGGGSNTLDYSNLPIGIIVNFDAKTITKTSHTDTFEDIGQITTFKGTGFGDVFMVSDIALLSGMSLDGSGVDGSGNSIDYDVLNITDNSGVTVDLSSSGVSGSIANIEEIQTADGDDTFMLGGDALYKTDAGMFTSINGGAGTDTADYSNSSRSITFDMSRARVTRKDGSGNDVIDLFTSIESVVGSTADDMFLGGIGNMKVDGAGGNDTLSFAYLGFNSIDINIDSQFISFVDLEGNSVTGRVDFDNVETIIGTRFNDRIDASNIPSSGFTQTITIDGGAGDDSISFFNKTSAQTLDFRSGAGINLGNVTVISFETIQLTKHDDTVLMSITDETSLDGGEGVDTFDISNATDSVSVSFLAGYITKSSGADVYVNSFKNFEIVKTGSGNDRFVLSDDLLNLSPSNTISLDAGAGNDLLDATNLFDISYSSSQTSTLTDTQLTLQYTTSGGVASTATMTNFESYSFYVIGSFNLSIQDDGLTGDISFVKQGATDTANVNFDQMAGGTSYEVVFDGSQSLVTTGAGGSATNYKILGVDSISATNGVGLHYKSSVIADYDISFSGGSATSTADYSEVRFETSFKVNSLTANGMDVSALKGSSAAITSSYDERLLNTTKIIGTINGDRFDLYENSTSTVFTIDLGGGVAENTVLLNSSTAVDVSIDASGSFAITGYNIINGNYVAGLTDKDDKVTITANPTTEIKFVGGGGFDTVDYSAISSNDMQVILEGSSINVIRSLGASGVGQDTFSEFEAIVASGADSKNTFLLNNILPDDVAYSIDGGTADTDINYYDTLILTNYAGSASVGLILDIGSQSVASSSASGVPILNYKNVEEIILSASSDTLKLYYTDFSAVPASGQVVVVDALGGTDTVEIQEGTVVDLTNGQFTIPTGASSTQDIFVSGVEIIDIKAANSSAETTIYVSTATSDSTVYTFKSTNTALSGDVIISYEKYTTGVTVANTASGNVQVTRNLSTQSDIIDSSVSDRATIRGSIYSDTFNISHFTDGSGNPLSTSYDGEGGNDTINLDYSSATGITSVEVIMTDVVTVNNTTASTTFAQDIKNMEAIVIDGTGKDLGISFKGSDILLTNIAINNANSMYVDLSELDMKYNTAISMTGSGYSFGMYSEATSTVVEYSFTDVTKIIYSNKTGSAKFDWVVDDTFLLGIAGGGSVPVFDYKTSATGNIANNLTFSNFMSVDIDLTADQGVHINSFTDRSGTVTDISAKDLVLLESVFSLTLTTGDDVLSGSVVGIDMSASYDLGFGNNIVNVSFENFGNASNSVAVNYVIDANGYVAAAHKNNTTGNFTALYGVAELNSYVGRDTLTLKDSTVNFVYNPGDRDTILANKTSSSNIGKDEFVFSSSKTGYLGKSVFSMQHFSGADEGMSSNPVFGYQDWGLYKQTRVDHLNSTILFEDNYGMNRYVLDSATGDYTIDNTVRIITSASDLIRIGTGTSSSLTNRPDMSSLYALADSYGDATDDSYKDNPYILYNELELGGGSNTVISETSVWTASDSTWHTNTEFHLTETADGRFMLNIAMEPDDRVSGNRSLVTDAGGDADLIDTEADMAGSAYAGMYLTTIYADDFDTLMGPSYGRFTFRSDFDTYVKVNPLVSSGDTAAGLSSNQSAYSSDQAHLYNVSDKYVHVAYKGQNDGLSFSYGTSMLDVDYSTVYMLDNINELVLEVSNSTVVFSIYAQMPGASGVNRFTRVTLTEFSQDSMLDYSGYAVNTSSALTLSVSYDTQTSVFADPSGFDNEKMGGINFGSVLLPNAYSTVNININGSNFTEDMKYHTPSVSPTTIYNVTYSNTAINIIDVAGTSGNSYTYVQRYSDANGNGVLDSGELTGTDYFYFDMSSGSVSRSNAGFIDDNNFTVTHDTLYATIGSTNQQVVTQNATHEFTGGINNVVTILGAETGSLYKLGAEMGDLIVNEGITDLHIGQDLGLMLDGSYAVSYGDGVNNFYVAGADYVKAGMDSNYSLYGYADIQIIATEYNESITVFDIDASYSISGTESIELIDYSNLDSGFTFSLSAGGGYITDSYGNDHAAKIGDVQEVKGSLGNDSFMLDDASDFTLDGLDGVDVVSIANIDKSTTASDLADSIDNIEILEISNIESDTFEITVEDIINMTDENNNLVIKTEDQDTILQIISSSSDYLLTSEQDANGNYVYSIYSSSDPSQQIGEVTVVKDSNNSNNI